jgi:hypothetical protein
MMSCPPLSPLRCHLLGGGGFSFVGLVFLLRDDDGPRGTLGFGSSLISWLGLESIGDPSARRTLIRGFTTSREAAALLVLGRKLGARVYLFICKLQCEEGYCGYYDVHC